MNRLANQSWHLVLIVAVVGGAMGCGYSMALAATMIAASLAQLDVAALVLPRSAAGARGATW